MMATIRPIPKDVQSSMRSGTVLFDLTRVVEELIYNSLDAGATKVSVCVGIRTCYIRVVDNGSGINRDGLMLLGEKYTTSKMKYLADMDAAITSFGFRGEALGSVSDVSVLEIITKTHGMPNGYRKIIKGCKCLYFGVDDSRQDIGTTVTVRDLYYNQPVRRKRMQNSPRKILHSVKECALRIALVHPKISFNVTDVESEELLFSTKQSTSPLSLLIKNFGAESCESFLELNTTDGVSRLSGYISGPQDTYQPKALQFIYINLRYVGKCLIHKLLNELASKFAFPCASTVSKRNRAQMHPSYILNLTCPRSFYDLSFEPSHTLVEFKDWSSLLTFIERTILKFWSKKHSGDISKSVAPPDEGEPLIPIEEDSRTKFHDLENMCWIENAKTSVEYLTKKRCQKQDSESAYTLSFQSPLIMNGSDNKKCARDFVLDTAPHSWNCDEKTNWSIKGCHEYQCPEDKLCYLKDKSQVYNSNLVERGRNSVKDYHSRMDEDFFQVRPTIKKSRHKELCDDYFNLRDDIGNFSFKPFLQSCSTREVTSFGELSCANDDEDDIFNIQQIHVNLIDRVDATKDESYQDIKIAGSSGPNDLITNAYPCSPDRNYSTYGTQGQCVDILGKIDGVTDGCYQMDNYVTRALWQVDPVSDLLSPPHKKTCSFNGDYMEQSSEDRDLAVRKFDLSRCDKGEFGLNNFSFDSEALDSIYHDQDTFGFSREWSGHPSFEPEAKRKKGAYHDDLLYREMEDVLVDHDVSPRDVEDKYCDRLLEFENCEYVNKYAPNYIEKYYQDDYQFAENKNLCANDANSCYNSCYMDTMKASSCSKSSYNDIPSSYGCFEFNERKSECQADERSRRERIRSRSAPPFIKSRKKFVVLSDFTSKEKNSDSKSAIRASVTQEKKMSEDLPQSSDASHPHANPNIVQNLFSAGSQMKIKPDRGLDMHEIPQKKLKTSLDLIQSRLLEDQRPKEIQMTIDSGMKWRDCNLISAIDQSRNFHHEKNTHDQQSILDVSSGILQYSADLLVPESIDKDCLMDAKVLQQVDKKFIPIVGKGILAVIDQHAADERIKLEELRHKVLSGEIIKTTYLDQEQVMELPEVGYQLLHKYATQVESWGWICNVHAQASESLTKNMNLLHTSSTKVILLAVPIILGISLSDVDLLEYLQQLADTDGSSTIPPAILRILNSKACRGAIMFGDTLLPSECSLLVDELKNTSLCFQCAHGRPTAVPLVNLRALHKQIAKLPTSNGESHESWHGLYRRQFSVDTVEKQ